LTEDNFYSAQKYEPSLKPEFVHRAALLVCLLLLPAWVGALAGMAESYRNYNYNDLAQVQWGNPGEFCPTRADGRYCMHLTRPDAGTFKELDYIPIDEINLPTEPASPYVIARPSLEDLWFVYNLKTEQYVISKVSYPAALEVWIRLGLQEPGEFVQSSRPANKLQETRDSVVFRWSNSLQLWFLFGLPVFVLLLLFAIVTRRAYKRYQAQGARRYLAFALFLFLPTAILLFVVVESFVGVIWQNIT